MSDDFDVSVRILSSAGVELIDLNDRAIGLKVESVQELEESYREVRSTAPRVPGSSLHASVLDDGYLVVFVHVKGTSWAQCTARWEAVRAAYRAEPQFLLETEVEGVTKRWQAERPNVADAGIDSSRLVVKSQTYQLRFRVQPDPTVSID